MMKGYEWRKCSKQDKHAGKIIEQSSILYDYMRWLEAKCILYGVTIYAEKIFKIQMRDNKET